MDSPLRRASAICLSIASCAAWLTALGTVFGTSAAAQSRILSVDGAPAENFSRAVAIVGDLDGDLCDEVVIGAPKAPAGGDRRGRVQVRSGRTGAVLFTFVGQADFDELGFAVCNPGDVNDDGLDDIAAGTFGGNYARVWSGSNGAVLHTFTTGVPGDFFGYALDGAGDVNGDGHADLIVGTNRILVFAPGFARVFSGLDGTILFTLSGDALFDGFGNAVAGGSDVNGDGIPDFAVGAPGFDANGNDAGRVRVFSGASGAPLHVFNGDAVSDELGSSVDFVDDVNGDGKAEIVAGAPGCGSAFACPGKKGFVRLWDGATGAVRKTIFGRQAQSLFGTSVAGLGDVDGDGRGDFALGASGADDRSRVDNGLVEVASGWDGAPIFFDVGQATNAGLGVSLGGRGDLNGDGVPDVFAGATGGGSRGFSIALGRSAPAVALSAGGAQTLSLVAGAENANAVFALMGTLFGTEPGIPVAGVNLPLNIGMLGSVSGADITALVFQSLRGGHPSLLAALVTPVPYPLPIVVRVGYLDANGEHAETLAIPPGAFPGLAGLSVHHAYLVFDATSKKAVLASNAVELVLAP